MSRNINRVYFREVQRFRQWWVWAIVLAPVLVLAYGMYKQLVSGESWGDNPLSNQSLTGITSALVLIAAWVYLMRLITEVRDDGVRLHYLFLWRPKTIPFRRIRRAYARTYHPISEYGGWGIRMEFDRRGWAYNVSGTEGVQLELDDGSRLLIGSQRAGELERAIHAGIQSKML